MDQPDLTQLDDDTLDRMACHTIVVAKLKRLCNPWSSWAEQEHPITQKEVRACIAQGRAELTHTPLWTELMFGRIQMTPEENRDLHVRKIAWFVINGFDDPLHLEVGCQGLGVMAPHLIEDGNHRFAAAIMRGDKTVPAKIGGGLDDAKERGLWAPNAAYLELERRWNEQQARKKRSPKG